MSINEFKEGDLVLIKDENELGLISLTWSGHLKNDGKYKVIFEKIDKYNQISYTTYNFYYPDELESKNHLKSML